MKKGNSKDGCFHPFFRGFCLEIWWVFASLIEAFLGLGYKLVSACLSGKFKELLAEALRFHCEIHSLV